MPAQPESAQPESAQPESGQPESAQPESGQPESGQPPRHSQSRVRGGSRSRRAALSVAAAAAVVLFPTAIDFAVAGTADTGTTGHGNAEHAAHVGAPAAAGSPAVPDESAEQPTDGDEPTDNEAGDENAGGGEGETDAAAEEPAPATAEPPEAEEPAAAPAAAGLDVLGDDCSTSELQPHDGFQQAPRCVAIAFGEVAAAERSPSLLITESPSEVGSDEAFTLEVSTRNLVRDRFLGAAAGGYYRESSFLDDDGVQRGHFHTACRMLPSLDEAPDAAPAPAFFLATQDGGGGAEPDRVTVEVPGLPESGTAQCAVWAGDGSHRVPMMERANQTPAFDMVRITVG